MQRIRLRQSAHPCGRRLPNAVLAALSLWSFFLESARRSELRGHCLYRRRRQSSTLPVTVRDKHARFVRDLLKRFHASGRRPPADFRYFSQEANLRYVGLLVDTSRSQTNVLDVNETRAAVLSQML